VPGRSVTSMWHYAKFSGGRSRKGGNQPLDRKRIRPEKSDFRKLAHIPGVLKR